MDFLEINELNHELPWTINPRRIFFAKESLIFTLFHINPYTKGNIDEIFYDLNQHFKPWLDSYIWNVAPLSLQKIESSRGTYIYGELVYCDYNYDEWLVTWLLFKFSTKYQDIYIHMFDQDGEFLLIEAASFLPDWLEPGVSFNRPWINNGKLIIIPNEYYKGENLKLEQSLIFLENVIYKCEFIIQINDHLNEKLKEFPQKILENIFSVKAILNKKVINLLVNNKPYLGSLCISRYSAKDILTTRKEEQEGQDDMVEVNIRISFLSYMYLKSILKIDNAIEIGKIISQGLNYLLKNETEEAIYINKISTNKVTDEDIKQFSISNSHENDNLQTELKRLNVIEKFIPPNHENDQINDSNSGKIQEKELFTQIKDFFKNSKKNDYNEYEKDYEENSSQSDNDNISIDEDDFFEFFCKEALKMKDEDLEKMRNTATTTAANKNENNNEINSEDENDLDDSEIESLSYLMKSLKAEGFSGPTSSLLASMGLDLYSQKES